MKKILTVAGSDSSGGAGIQADLKAIGLMGEYGLSVITALTAQNTQGVVGIFPNPLDFISSQWDAVISDIKIDVVKTGMLGDEKIVNLISRKIKKSKIPIRVFDPVMVAKSGAFLLSPSGRTAFAKEMLPLATIVTPNIPEAQILCGFPIRNERDIRMAAQRIHQLGARNVLIKGGHRKGKAEDVLYDGKEFFLFSRPRIDTVHTHGTGCTLASAIAVELARNTSVPEAVEKAKEFITSAI
ncbi:MAG: bifunctional hydroxymethylpyrimidine kinase/phosphomethylpyrimidine kinase, partial [Desulfobacterota bacterium]|nr:bifunctional hydroxymethylpyrimidine kinase/phosphomethylpyrimidine kinase [Thermodesulfobacteriota bacterium]